MDQNTKEGVFDFSALRKALNRKQDRMMQIDQDLNAATDKIQYISNALELTGDTCTVSSARKIQRNIRILLLARRVRKRMAELKKMSSIRSIVCRTVFECVQTGSNDLIPFNYLVIVKKVPGTEL